MCPDSIVKELGNRKTDAQWSKSCRTLGRHGVRLNKLRRTEPCVSLRAKMTQ